MVHQMFLMLFALTAVTPCDAMSPSELTDRHDVRGIFWHVLGHAHYGFDADEVAVFIVRNDNGGYSFVSWPSAGEPNCGRWFGAFPRGTVAIAHTHLNYLPLPSSVDMTTASRCGVPVYVITRTRVTRTDGVATHTVIDGEWKPLT